MWSKGRPRLATEVGLDRGAKVGLECGAEVGLDCATEAGLDHGAEAGLDCGAEDNAMEDQVDVVEMDSTRAELAEEMTASAEHKTTGHQEATMEDLFP